MVDFYKCKMSEPTRLACYVNNNQEAVVYLEKEMDDNPEILFAYYVNKQKYAGFVSNAKFADSVQKWNECKAKEKDGLVVRCGLEHKWAGYGIDDNMHFAKDELGKMIAKQKADAESLSKVFSKILLFPSRYQVTVSKAFSENVEDETTVSSLYSYRFFDFDGNTVLRMNVTNDHINANFKSNQANRGDDWVFFTAKSSNELMTTARNVQALVTFGKIQNKEELEEGDDRP